MISNWNVSDCDALVEKYKAIGVGEDVAKCVYATRLIGRNSSLVLHGGGNTSVKTVSENVFGEFEDVICVKGSGWDMAAIEQQGLPALRLKSLTKLQMLETLSDEQMMNYFRSNLMEATSPSPSVETLSHAFIPRKFVNHSHATSILSLTNQPNGNLLCAEIFGERMTVIPYVMPGFDLAKEIDRAVELYENIDGLILLNHGIFTFSDDAQSAYELMIDAVNTAEETLQKSGTHFFEATNFAKNIAPKEDVSSLLRGVCTKKFAEHCDSVDKKIILVHRSNDLIDEFVNGKDIHTYAQKGVATPDHVIRTKNLPLILGDPQQGRLQDFAHEVELAFEDYISKYNAYFERESQYESFARVKLDPIPRVIFVRGVGLFGVGETWPEANISADIAEEFIKTVKGAESLGGYKSLDECDVFDVEYWSLEQAKLKHKNKRPLDGNVVLITGGAGTIGLSIAAEFKGLGAEIAIVDKKFDDRLSDEYFQVVCDVTSEKETENAFRKVCLQFGGLDIVVSNAGQMYLSEMSNILKDQLRRSFEINFFAHQNVSRNAVRVMKLQGLGGCILFNISKQAINPGVDAGPYGIPKAATLALMRQYALEYSGDGIRANAVNADRIKSGILTKDVIQQRSKARGLTEEKYMAGNLLGKEVSAKDVAKAFTFLAQAESTVACVFTVDGGNIEAALR